MSPVIITCIVLFCATLAATFWLALDARSRLRRLEEE